MAHVTGKANATSALMMLLDKTLCKVNRSVLLILMPSNDIGIAELSLLAEVDNVERQYM